MAKITRKIPAVFHACPVCGAARRDLFETSTGHSRIAFGCDAEFQLENSGLLVVTEPCPSPSWRAAAVIERMLDAMEGGQ